MYQYIINKNCELEYVNEKVRERYPDVAVGEKCHKAFCGLEAPCPDCPRQTKTTKKWTCFNPFSNVPVNVLFTPMAWEEEEDEARVLVSAEVHLQRIFGAHNVFRVGGDEFVVLLENEERHSFKEKVSLVKENVAETVAVGSVWDGGERTICELINLADRDMYQDKNEGHA